MTFLKPKKPVFKVYYPEDLLVQIENALESLFPKNDSCPRQLYEAMRYALFLPAKRFRPILTLLTAKTLTGEYEHTLPTACALEFIHTYSLIHDDLPAIDDDDLRRGQPTCHREYGEDIAILAGDALFAEAFVLISSKQSGNSDIIIQVIKEIAVASGIKGMVGGQTADILAVGQAIDTEKLSYIHRKKTGCLITTAVRAGALLSNASEQELGCLTAYAESLGLAFQIVDDILDITSSTEQLGKPAGSDVVNEKATFPILYGLERSQEMAAEAVSLSKEALIGLVADTEEMAGLADFVLERSR